MADEHEEPEHDPAADGPWRGDEPDFDDDEEAAMDAAWDGIAREDGREDGEAE